jgi:hypothetical protein
MQTAFKPLSSLTAAERLFRKAEQQADASKARIEYNGKQRAALANMHRLRALRIERERSS